MTTNNQEPIDTPTELGALLLADGESQETQTADDSGESQETTESAPGESQTSSDTDTTGESQTQGDQQETGESQKPQTPAAIAEALGMDPADLYTELKIPTGPNGETTSLGELKDNATRLANADAEVLVAQDKAREIQAESIKIRRELETVIGMLPPNALSPQALAAVRNEMQTTIERESGLILESIPTWENQETAVKDQEMMFSDLEPYGFTLDEFKGVYDSRLIRYVFDNARRNAEVKGLRKKPGKDGLKPSKNRGQSKQKPPPGLTPGGAILLG